MAHLFYFTLTLSCAVLLSARLAEAQRRPARPRVPWRGNAQFVLDNDLSDEFSGSTLNTTKWDEHGLRNPDTGCPRWNGPPSESFPDYSIFFPATDNPIPGGEPIRQYRLKRGRLEYRIRPQPLSFFEDREYYCNTTTFTCNHNPNIPCFATNFNGEPIYADKEKTQFRGVVHDKCKKSPFCIPHHLYVSRKLNRTYASLVAPHISSKKLFKYGFMEAKVKLPRSSAILAVWMHNDDMVNGYCRYRKMEGPFIRRLECPSMVRSRRWQEIDLLEGMNSEIHKTKFMSNVHSFAMNKGEFSSATAVDLGDGEMGGGPIIVKDDFKLKTPSFADVDPALRVSNDFHWNPGSLAELDTEWADKSRVVGVYWSPNEIRFYLDGVEVRRLKNTLIHQPMYLDISTAINVKWAQETPKAIALRKYSKVFYLRTWKVFTEDGVEPPSTLPLDTGIEDGFQDLYGNEMLGVFGRFPHNDNITDFPTIPDTADTVETGPADGTEGLGISRLGTMGGSPDYFDQSDHLPWEVRKRGPKFGASGGRGNRRFSRKRRQMNRRQKNAALANPRRISYLKFRKGKVVSASKVQDAEMTAFEDVNPNKNQASWASETSGGSGKMDDMA